MGTSSADEDWWEGGGVRVGVLGPMRVAVDGNLEPLGTGLPGRILALLAAAGVEGITSADLVRHLWGDDPPTTAMTSLRNNVTRVRRRLAGGVDSSGGRYRIDPSVVAVDAWAFDALVRQGRHLDAVRLWRGTPFPDSDIDMVDEIARDLRATFVRSFELVMSLDPPAPVPVAAVRHLARELGSDPYRESAAIALARCEAVAGAPVDALRTVQRSIDALRDDLGLEPTPVLLAAEAALLDHRPGDLARLLATALGPEQRSDASSVDAAAGPLGAPPVRVVTPPSSAALQSRAGVIEAAVGVMRSLTVGRPGANVLVSGEPGIGKSTLAASVVAAAHGLGVEVWHGSADGMGTTGAYRLAVTALGGLVQSELARGEISELDRRRLERLWPAIEDGAHLDTEGEVDRVHLFGAVAACVARVASDRPVTIWIDDAQDGDRDSLELFEHVSRITSAHPVSFVVCWRSTEVAADHPLTPWIATLIRSPGSKHTELGPLPVDDVATLLAHVHGFDAPPDYVAMLTRHGGGNPFFVSQLGLHLLETAAVRPEKDEWPDDIDALPLGVSALVRSRFDRLERVAGALVDILAVADAPLESGVLAHVAGIDATDLAAAVDELVVAAIVREITPDGGDILLQFVHPLFGQVARDRTSEARRRIGNARIAAALEALPGLAGGDLPGRLSWHWHQAGPTGDPRRLVAAATTAGRLAMAATAFRDAAEHVSRAVAGQRWHGGDDVALAELLLDLARACHRSGDLEGRRTAAEEACGLARTAPEIFALAALEHGGIRSTYGIRSSRTMELLDDALELVGADRLDDAAIAIAAPATPMVARLLARNGQEHYHVRDFATGERLVDRALAMAEATGDRRLAAAILESRVWVCHRPHLLRGRIDAAEQMVARAAQVGDDELLLLGRIWLASAWIEAGNFSELDELAPALVAHAEALPIPSHLFRVRLLQATLAILRADHDTGALLMGDAHRIGSVIEPDNADQCFAAQGVPMLREQGLLVAALPLVEPMLDRFADVPGWACAAAFVHATSGDLGRAAELIADIRASGLDAVPDDLAWLMAMSFLAETSLLLDDAHLGALVHARLAPYADRFVGLFDIACNGSVEHHLGLAARAMGDLGAAAVHLGRAVDRHDAAGAGAFAARSRVELVEVLVLGDGPTDTARVDRLGSEAAALVDRLGLIDLAARL